ncbi:MAG: hypothetical protein ACFFD7_02365 [Candidatus Thorarchaeota archaeon]
MRKSIKITIKLVVVFSFLVLIFSALFNYFYAKTLYFPNTPELILSKSNVLVSLSIFSLILMFIMNISIFRKLFLIFIVCGVIAWNLLHLNNVLGVILLPSIFLNMLEVVFYLSVAMVTPGIVLFIVYYIKKISVKFGGNFIRGYHLHESFLGIILLGLGITLFIIRFNIIQIEIFWKEYKLYLAIIMIFLYAFLYFGSFFAFRDYHDLIRLRFLEKVNKPVKNESSTVSAFNSITTNDLHFFKHPKLCLFPFGLLLTSLTFLMVIYGNDFIPKEYLTHEFIVNSGYLLSIVAGGIIGIDWLRIFKIFYPSHYQELELKIKEISS